MTRSSPWSPPLALLILSSSRFSFAPICVMDWPPPSSIQMRSV